MVSSEQRADVDKRVEFTCVTNSAQRTHRGMVINIHAAIRLAFVLGTRFGLSQPTVAGDFMGRWIVDHTDETEPEEMGQRHEQALAACVQPLSYTPDQYWRNLDDE